jgi:RNA polymerase-interacting CarD/CdnL/TRCF family regulator
MFELGQQLVLRGQGVVNVEAIAADGFVVVLIDDRESTFEVPRETAAEALRPLVSAEQAQAALCRFDMEQMTAGLTAGQRAIRYRRAVKGGVLFDQIDALVAIYRHPDADYPEHQYRKPLEKAVMTELALVLGRNKKLLKAELRGVACGLVEAAKSIASLPDRSADLSRHRSLTWSGYKGVGAFAVDTQIAIGEAYPLSKRAAENGIWLVYTKAGAAGETVELVAVHEEHFKNAQALVSQALLVAETEAQGNTIAVYDAAAAEDEDFVDDVQRAGQGSIGQRCVVVDLGSDSLCRVHVAHNAARGAILTRLEVA